MKLNKFFIYLSLLGMSLISPVWAGMGQCFIVITKTDSLNIRDKPSLKSQIIKKAAKDSALWSDTSAQNGFQRVCLNSGECGFASTDYLDAPTLGNCGTVKTQKTSLNIRKKPDLNSSVIGQAKKSSALRILDKSGAWYQIKLNSGIIGYAHSDYVIIFDPR